MITQKRLKELLHYDPITGVFTWRVRRGGRAVAGSVAGTIGKDGYVRIFVDGVSQYAQRLAFLYMEGRFPPVISEHRNLNPSDNRWENLRPATHSQNGMNKPARSDNKLGVKGVIKTKSGKFQSEIGFAGKRVYLGLFSTLAEASAAYDAAADVHHGEFARHAPAAQQGSLGI